MSKVPETVGVEEEQIEVDGLIKSLEPGQVLSDSQIKQFMQRRIENFQAENELPLDELHKVQRHPLFYAEDATISFKDVSFSVDVTDPKTKEKSKKVILEPCSGVLRPGHLIAVMGPSGCGKSTLVDILAGKKKPGSYDGEVYLNGNPRDELFSQVTAYVPQADVMPPLWRVKEAVMFNLQLRRPRPKRQLPVNVYSLIAEEILASLGLSHVKDSLIGDATVRGISGGQRRRVTLARGLVSGANAIFCDEPTSGLSSTDAETCVARLKGWCRRFGNSISVVAALFDDLILLTSQPGRMVYNGPMKDAAEHYSKLGYPVPQFVNPADFYLDMISPGYRGEQSKLFADHYRESEAPRVAAEVEATLATKGLTSREVIDRRYAKQEVLMGPLDTPARGLFVAPFHRQLRIVFRRAQHKGHDHMIGRDRWQPRSPQAPPRRSLRSLAAGRCACSHSACASAVRLAHRPVHASAAAQVFSRQVKLMLRNRKMLIVDYVVSVVKGLVVGIAFFDIGADPPINQIAFIFLVLQMAVLGQLSGMGAQIADRTVMKFDTSDLLYPVSAFLVSTFIIKLVTGLISNLLFVLVCFAMGGIDFDYFADYYLWFLLCTLTFEGFFAMIAAVASSMEDAILRSMPGMLLFMLFNGFFVTKATVLNWMEWAIYASPFYNAISQTAVALYSDGTAPTDPSYTQSGQYVVDLYKFEEHNGQSVGVMMAELVIFRVLQAIFLNKLNNIEK